MYCKHFNKNKWLANATYKSSYISVGACKTRLSRVTFIKRIKRTDETKLILLNKVRTHVGGLKYDLFMYVLYIV